MTTVRLGTRGSALAVTQSRWVARRLEEAARSAGLDLTVDLVEIRTQGDVDPTHLAELGGVGVFAAALREALLAGRCDLAVHSYKDLPTAPTPGLCVAAVPQREDPCDVLCLRDSNLPAGLDGLPRGARVGTGSPRRGAQLLALRPDLEIVPIRGNVPTRLARVVGSVVSADGPMGAMREPDLDAVVLAHAGMRRLGLERYASVVLEPALMLPAAAQGALAIEVREAVNEHLPALAAALALIDDPLTRACADAERALMRALGAGCAAPVGALARSLRLEADEISLDAAVVSLDGRERRHVTVTGNAGHAVELGQQGATALLADGAAAITNLAATKDGHAHPAPTRQQGGE